MTDTLSLAGSLLLATQHGPLVTVRIDGCEGEIVMGVDKWLALRAMADVLRAADGEVARLREERDHAREKQRQAFYEMDCAHTERDHARWSAEIKEKAALAALSERDSLRSTIDALKQECERMRGELAMTASKLRYVATVSENVARGGHADVAIGYFLGAISAITDNIDTALDAKDNTAHVSREKAKDGSK